MFAPIKNILKSVVYSIERRGREDSIFDRLSRYKIPLFGPQKKMKNFSKTFSTWCNRQKKKKKKTSVAPGTKNGVFR
jgi:hypothetical protein